MMVKEAVDDFLVMRATRLSQTTQRWYTSKLTEWMNSPSANQQLFGAREIESLRPVEIAGYLQGLSGLSSYTVHGYAQVIKGFLSWCLTNEYIERFNLRAIEMPKVDQKIIEVFTPAHIKQLLAATAREETPWLAARDKAIILFLLDTGVRSAELCGLTLDRLDLKSRTATVLGKGRKERQVAFGDETLRLLSLFIRRYRRAEEGVNTVFTTKRGQPLTGSGLDQMLYRLEGWTSITGVRVSAHTFRHTFAVNYLTQGGDVMVLSKLLGHNDVSTTGIYLRAAKVSQLLRQRPSIVDTLLS